MWTEVSIVLLALVLVAIVFARGASLIEERQFLKKHAALSVEELTARATALLSEGGADRGTGEALLALLAKRDYDAMLRSMRGTGENYTELKHIITALARRGADSDAASS